MDSINGWKNDPNKRALAIVRRSSAGQKDNTSGTTQEEAIAKYCEVNNLNLIKVESIIETAYDSDSRKKYRMLMRYAEAHDIKHILFYVSSRECRNLRDSEENETLIKNDKIIIHHVSDGKVFYKDTPAGDFLVRDINAAVNKNYSRENGVKVKRAFLTKAESGWFPYMHTPLGYVHTKQKGLYGNEIKGTAVLVPDSNKRNVEQVIREFELRAAGNSYCDIRKQIIDEGFIAPDKVKNYNRSTIEKRTKNSLYWGYFHLKNDPKKYEGKHELIIPAHILKAVEDINNSNGRRPVRPMSERGLFNDGWIRCGNPECECQLTFDPKKKTIKATGEQKTYHYYRCTNSRQIHEKVTSIAEAKIFEAFEPALAGLTITEDFAKDIVEALNENHITAKKLIKREMESYRESLSVLEQREDKVYRLLEDGTIDKTTYQKRIGEIRKDRDDYNLKLEQAQLRINDDSMIAVQKIFELTKDAYSLWKAAPKHEQYQKLKQVCSNPTYNGSTIQYDLQKPFLLLSKMKENPNWRREGETPGAFLKLKVNTIIYK